MKWYYMLMFMASVFGIFQVLAIGTFGMSPLELCYTVFFLYLPFHLYALGRPVRFPVNLENVALVGFIVCTLISSVYVLFLGETRNNQQFIKTALHFFFVVVIMFVHGHLRITPAFVNSILRFYLSFCVLLSLYAVYQVPARIMDLPLAWMPVTNVSFHDSEEYSSVGSQLALKFENFYRATSVYSEPSSLGYASAMQIVLVLVPILRKSKHFLKTKWAVSLSLVTSVIALFLAFSMTGVLVMFTCLAVVILLYPKRVVPRLLPIVGITAACILVADVLAMTIVDISVLDMFRGRIGSYVTGAAFSDVGQGTIIGESATQRYDDIRVAYEVWKDSPVTGYGFGCFRHHVYGRLHNSTFPSNTYATVLVDTGLLGLLSYVFMLGCFVMVTFSLERRWTKAGMAGHYPDADSVVAIAPVYLVGMLVVNMSGNTVVNHASWLHFLPIVAAWQIARKTFGEYKEVEFYGHRISRPKSSELDKHKEQS
jgi:hypothetical protein